MISHEEIITWKRLSHYWPCCEGNSRKASNEELWCFLLLTWIGYWTNSCVVGDLRRHDAHVTSLKHLRIITTGTRALSSKTSDPSIIDKLWNNIILIMFCLIEIIWICELVFVLFFIKLIILFVCQMLIASNKIFVKTIVKILLSAIAKIRLYIFCQKIQCRHVAILSLYSICYVCHYTLVL